MIQRKQSLYLLAGLLLISFNLFSPFVATNELIFSAFDLKTGIETNFEISVFPIAIYTIIVAVLHLFTIFLFKNRKIQMRFTTFLILLSIGYYGVLLFYHYMITEYINIDFSMYSYGLITPLLVAVFDFMAYGGIKKDEKLIRDSERLR